MVLFQAAANALRQQLQPQHMKLQQSVPDTIHSASGKHINKMHAPKSEAHAITSDLIAKLRGYT